MEPRHSRTSPSVNLNEEGTGGVCPLDTSDKEVCVCVSLVACVCKGCVCVFVQWMICQ